MFDRARKRADDVARAVRGFVHEAREWADFIRSAAEAGGPFVRDDRMADVARGEGAAARDLMWHETVYEPLSVWLPPDGAVFDDGTPRPKAMPTPQELVEVVNAQLVERTALSLKVDELTGIAARLEQELVQERRRGDEGDSRERSTRRASREAERLKLVRQVECPACGAKQGSKCFEGAHSCAPHRERFELAISHGIIKTEVTS